MLREVQTEGRADEQRLLRLLAQLDREVEQRGRLDRSEIRAAQEVAARQGDGSRQHPQRSFAAATAAATSPMRGAGSAGGSNAPARTVAATCSCASRNGTPSRTSASAASVARSSGSEAAAASRVRSNCSPSTSVVRAASASLTSRRARKLACLSSERSELYARGSPFTVASKPASRPIAVPAFPRATSATSGFSFCGIIDEPVAAFSGRRANANSLVTQRHISSQIRERWTKSVAHAYR